MRVFLFFLSCFIVQVHQAYGYDLDSACTFTCSGNSSSGQAGYGYDDYSSQESSAWTNFTFVNDFHAKRAKERSLELYVPPSMRSDNWTCGDFEYPKLERPKKDQAPIERAGGLVSRSNPKLAENLWLMNVPNNELSSMLENFSSEDLVLLRDGARDLLSRLENDQEFNDKMSALGDLGDYRLVKHKYHKAKFWKWTSKSPRTPAIKRFAEVLEGMSAHRLSMLDNEIQRDIHKKIL